MMPDSINFKFPCDSFNDILHYFTLVPVMHTFFSVVAEYVNTSSLERLTLFCAFHFSLLFLPYNKTAIFLMQRNQEKPLSFVKFIITNPSPTLTPKHLCHLISPVIVFDSETLSEEERNGRPSNRN